MRSGRLLLAPLFTLALAFGARAQSMSVENLDGPVTTNEVNSFVSYIQTLNPVVWPNTGSMENEYAQGHSGENIKAMGLMYEISGNADILNRMIYFCDTLLSQRNDLLAAPNGQRVYWNGKISPAWPGQALGTSPVYSTSASGDCVGHLANCARLILQTPSLWSVTVPDGNPFGFGVTYLDRAKTYVTQADYTFSNCFFPDMLTLTNPGLTNVYCYPAGSPYQPGNQYPWNQAMMMNYPLQNLAIAHTLLGDNPALASQYDNLVQTNVGRFFTDPTVSQLRTDSAGNLAYDWAYNPSANGGEDSNHGSLDVAGFYRAFATGRYGIAPAQMKPFANTVTDIMTLTIGSYYAGTVEGCTTCTGHAGTTTYLRSGYFLTAEFRPDQYYNMVQGLHISAPGTTTSTDAFSRLMWIKNRRYNAANAFYVSASPATANPIAGSTATYTVKVTPSSTFTGAVGLAVNGLPGGTSATFSPASLTTSGTSTLTVSTSLTTTPGTYYLTLSGTSGTSTQTAEVVLVVGSPQVATPSFSPPAGTYSSTQAVAISSATAGATIRYTTDGSIPSETNGTIYSGPVSIAATTTLQAMAYAPGMFDSVVASATYTIQNVAQLPLSASSVTASTYTSSYVPANTVDGNLSTRWAGKGDGVWIRYDLGAVNTVNYVNIAWYQGTTRVYTFDLQVSNDATTWTTLLNRQTTSKATNGFETYNLAPINARYVRVVGHMNTTDTYTNITEVQIWGAAPFSTTSVTSNPSAVFATSAQTVALSASVTPSAGTLNSGTVTFTILDGSVPVGAPVAATVTNNTATATYALPAGQHAGTYTIQAVFGGSAPFAGSSTTNGTLTIAKATPTITWPTPDPIVYGDALGDDELNATADTSGSFDYTPDNGALLSAGDHTLTVTFLPSDTTDYETVTASVTLTVNKATPVLTWPAPAPIVFGTPLGAAQLNATANIPGALAYTPAAGTLLNAGSGQILSATFAPADTANYVGGTVSTSIDVRQANAAIHVQGYSGTYDAKAHGATGSAIGVWGENLSALLNLGTTFTNVPGGVATWTFAGDANYAPASGTVSITIVKASPTISVAPYNVTYDATAHTATGSAHGVLGETLAGLDLTGTTHTNADSYNDPWTFTDVTGNYANAGGTITDKIAQAPATISLAPLAQWYDGTPRTVTATTTPANLGVAIAYNGASTAPTLPGDYVVLATITDPNYTGTATDTLSVASTALVRHGLTLNGEIDGSVQILLGDATTLNGSSGITGDLLVPGTPSLKVNGRATYAGTKDNPGTVATDPYTVTLNGSSLLRYLVRGVDPLPMPTVATPPLPVGSRDVVLNAPGSIGDASTLRNLTLNAKAGAVAVPPGTYGSFTANGTSGFILGIAGTTDPVVYNLQSLTLNSNAQLQVVGPVIIDLAIGVTLNAGAGNSAQPSWLTLQIANGGLTLNNGAVYGSVVAPAGTVSLNGNATLTGSVTADRLVINGSASLVQGEP